MQPNSSQSHNLNIATLVSVGKHPQSGRVRRADQDSRAVELGLRLTADNPAGLTVLHAGDPAEPSLRSYAGMGLAAIKVLQLDPAADAVAPLGEQLQQCGADIVLTGVRAESGEGSGMLPYQLAEKLGWPIVPRVADIVAVQEGVAEVLQALPRGQRRAIKVRLPFIASIDTAAPAARQSAFGPAQRAEMRVSVIPAETDTVRQSWDEAVAKKRPKRLKVIKAKTAAERFKAATAKSQSEGGRIMKQEAVDEQAQAILDLLIEEGVLR
ncbi:electron transfer flavoprotein subunit beta [Amphritea sp. 1_MG-2023]|uniref:electron transfer flavoprotein subunit beta n=1 Tax=Amphritea sp. 1_MG-2023 TaxID=3062670 RepID=UPI0026E30A0C|nr:electron transfer flavoprotein subunit beta [Amphritea sp. 1_MG-2023]MDO6561936.1 electron transfer flavoprotein subunit beta [Amphritea sp. 1_MG-2023]